MKLWFKRRTEQGYEDIELILCIVQQSPVPNSARSTALVALAGLVCCIDKQFQNDYMNLKQRNLGNPKEWEDYNWIRGAITKDILGSDLIRKFECL